jgi:hypothetical protein
MGAEVAIGPLGVRLPGLALALPSLAVRLSSLAMRLPTVTVFVPVLLTPVLLTASRARTALLFATVLPGSSSRLDRVFR